MSGINHRLVLRTHDGEELAILTGLVKWDLIRVQNNIGWFTITASDEFDDRWPHTDRLVEFWRQPVGGENKLLAVGFTRYWEWENLEGRDILRFGGPDQVELLERRIIGYYKGESESDKTGPADDVIKAIVRENMGALAGNDWHGRPRRYPAVNFSVEPDFGDGHNIQREFSWRNVLPVIQEMADESAERGTPLFFDNVPVAPAQFIFRTWTGVRGIDRSIIGGVAPIIFSLEAGNLANPSLRFDYTEEINYVWGGGQGEGAARDMDPENDQVREHLTIWNKREAFQDAREETVHAGVTHKAFMRMQAGLPKVKFSGELLDTPQSRFGIDWDYGDKVTVRYRGMEFSGRVNSFSINVNEQGTERISAKVEITEAIEGHPT